MAGQRFSRDEEARYTGTGPALRLAFHELSKGLYTMMPGTVVSYADQRAVVQPDLKVLFHDGREMSRPPIHDVPVAHPSGGGFTVHLPLEPGDKVLLLFSMRGLTRWKQAMRESAPDRGSVMAMVDAIAYPGLPPTDLSPVRSGLAIQSTDGTTHVLMESNRVTIQADEIVFDGNIRTTGNAQFDGEEVHHREKNIGKDHEHSIATAEVLKVAAPKTPAPIPTITSIKTDEPDDA